MSGAGVGCCPNIRSKGGDAFFPSFLCSEAVGYLLREGSGYRGFNGLVRLLARPVESDKKTGDHGREKIAKTCLCTRLRGAR